MKERLDIIYQKVKHLLDKQSEMQSTIVQLQQELELKSSEVLTVIKEKENLENKLNFYTLAPESLNKKEIKQKIDKYIEEIDNCIKMLDNK